MAKKCRFLETLCLGVLEGGYNHEHVDFAPNSSAQLRRRDVEISFYQISQLFMSAISANFMKCCFMDMEQTPF